MSLQKLILICYVNTDDFAGYIKDDIYNRIHRTPKVEILDGYIAITSSNLDALDRFKERVLRSNEVTFEHRIKKHGNITMHSYIFKMD